jgi:hypothetical protein
VRADGSDELSCDVVLECDSEFGEIRVFDWMVYDREADCLDASDEPNDCAERTQCQ